MNIGVKEAESPALLDRPPSLNSLFPPCAPVGFFVLISPEDSRSGRLILRLRRAGYQR